VGRELEGEKKLGTDDQSIILKKRGGSFFHSKPVE